MNFRTCTTPGNIKKLFFFLTDNTLLHIEFQNTHWINFPQVTTKWHPQWFEYYLSHVINVFKMAVTMALHFAVIWGESQNCFDEDGLKKWLNSAVKWGSLDDFHYSITFTQLLLNQVITLHTFLSKCEAYSYN